MLRYKRIGFVQTNRQLQNRGMWLLGYLMLFSCSLFSVAQAVREDRQLPDFNVVFNNDGDLSATGQTPAESVRNLRLMLGRLTGTPVKTVTYSVGAGSDILYYPTKVASTWGWRRTPYEDDPSGARRVAKNKAAIETGVDFVRVAGERVKSLGMRFLPSYRMNDWHFAYKPYDYVLTGEFWMESHEELRIGSPVLEDPMAGVETSNLFDYSHPEVRQYRLDIIFEVIERNQDIIDGMELDFNRVQVFFPKGKAQERAHLMTDLVARVRARLDEVAERQDRPLYLFVRVPPTLRNCRWSGLEVEKWMKARLVDVVIPAQLMTLSHDMPIDEFVAVAAPSGVKVYPAIYPRSGYHWPFVQNPSPKAYAGGPDRRHSMELVRGAIANYWHMGATGFEMYNYGCVDDVWSSLAFWAAAHPAALAQENVTYAITPAYYIDHEDTLQYKKQVPVKLEADQEQSLTLYIGQDFTDQTRIAPPDYVALRLGLRGVGRDVPITVELNNQVIHQGPTDKRWTKTGGENVSTGFHPSAASCYVQISIEDLHLLRPAVNTVCLSAGESAADHEMQLTEVHLGVLYHSRIFSW